MIELRPRLRSSARRPSNTDPGRLVRYLAFAPDGNTLATGSENGTLELWPWRDLLGQPGGA
jgi:WD40 repeat protein